MEKIHKKEGDWVTKKELVEIGKTPKEADELIEKMVESGTIEFLKDIGTKKGHSNVYLTLQEFAMAVE